MAGRPRETPTGRAGAAEAQECWGHLARRASGLDRGQGHLGKLPAMHGPGAARAQVQGLLFVTWGKDRQAEGAAWWRPGQLGPGWEDPGSAGGGRWPAGQPGAPCRGAERSGASVPGPGVLRGAHGGLLARGAFEGGGTRHTHPDLGASACGMGLRPLGGPTGVRALVPA